MSDYLSILPVASPMDQESLRQLALLACTELYRVDWLRAFVGEHEAKMLCWYSGPDAEAVRFVLRQQGSAGHAVWPVSVAGFHEKNPLQKNQRRVIVEMRIPGADADRDGTAGYTTEDMEQVLKDAGHGIVAAFTASSGDLLALVVDCQRAAPVSDTLNRRGFRLCSVWSCLEFDPRPPRLFGEQSVLKPDASVKVNSGSVGVVPPSPSADEFLTSSASARALKHLDALIIGAGISGIYALYRLREMGLKAEVYEAGGDVGGVWYWNRYPGARVDSETYSYGFSFSQQLLRQWQWSELFASQPELERYLRYVVDHCRLRADMHFHSRITSAHYDEQTGGWFVEVDGGESVWARYLIAATGVLSSPQFPDFPGQARFRGESHHTAQWPATGVDLDGKRVGVVGTGASGVQVIQTIAERVAALTVFQRTPTYCIPQRNHVLSTAEQHRIQRQWPAIFAACRRSFSGFLYDFDPRPGLALSPRVREARFEQLWERPGFQFWFANFADLMMNREVNAHASEFVRRKIRERVKDPQTVRKLLPDHPFGTKRAPLETGYYEAFNLEHVRLVDLRQAPIVCVTPTGIQTTAEEHPLDVIIYATGFDAATGALTRIDLKGLNGCTLADKWRDGPRTYMGMLVAGFPNLFIVSGPQNSAALCNASRCIEHNVDWISDCIAHLLASGYQRIEAQEAAEQEWTTHVENIARSTVLNEMQDSWFYGANTPGKARRIAVYAAGAARYNAHCDDVAASGYVGCILR